MLELELELEPTSAHYTTSATTQHHTAHNRLMISLILHLLRPCPASYIYFTIFADLRTPRFTFLAGDGYLTSHQSAWTAMNDVF